MGSKIDLLKEKFGALSQERDLYSRICIGNTAISLEPFRGCPLGCKYCMANNDVRSIKYEGNSIGNPDDLVIIKPEKLYNSVDLLQALIIHPAFIPGKTVVGFCIGSTEVFLPNVGENVWIAMKKMAQYGLKNPIWLVAKSFLSNNKKIWYNRFKYLSDCGIKTIISISDAGNPIEVEPFPKLNRFLPFEFFKDSGVYLSHHLRPIVSHPHVLDGITRSLDKSNNIVSSVCWGGLRLDPGMLLFMKQKESSGYTPGNQNKVLSPNIEQHVTSLVENLGIPLFHHSSEMISFYLGISDYNLNKYQSNEAFLEIPKSTIQRIEKESNQLLSEILKNVAQSIRLFDIRFDVNQNKIQINKQLKFQELHALKQAIGFSGIFN